MQLCVQWFTLCAFALIAQRIEQRVSTPCVGGSSPSGGALLFMYKEALVILFGGMSEWLGSGLQNHLRGFESRFHLCVHVCTTVYMCKYVHIDRISLIGKALVS